MTEHKIEKLHLKVLNAHENQENQEWGKRYQVIAKESIEQIEETRNLIPKKIKALNAYLGKIDTGLGRLETAGMIEGYLQSKDGDKMQIYTKQKNGKRVRLYVGNDEALQIQAAKYIENFETHQALARTGSQVRWAINQASSRMRECERILNAIKIEEVEK